MSTPWKKRRKDRALNPPYAVLLVLAAICLVLLVPLRGLTLSVAPSAALLATFVLFMVPGATLNGLLLRTGYNVPAGIPLAFASSAGVFGLLALPPLVLKWSMETYLLACGAVLVPSLVALAFLAFWGGSVRQMEPPDQEREAPPPTGRWLWVPFAGLVAALATISTIDYPPPGTDTWAYLMHVRDFMAAEQLNAAGTSGFSRTTLSGWLLELAALSWVSGVDPVDVVLTYLEPILIVVTFLAFYGLARTLFESEPVALLCGSLAALYFLLQLNPGSPVPRGEFIGYLTEDKHVARFVFLPASLSLAILFFRERKRRYLAMFAFLCCSGVAVHYIGFVLICVSLAGFGLVHLVVGVGGRRAWGSVAALWGVLLAIGLAPAVYLLSAGRSYLPSPDNAAWPEEKLALSWLLSNERLLELGDGTYIAHPSLLLNPVVLAAYLLGVPFLLWRPRSGPAAQLLLGILLLVPVLVYLPPVAGLVGEVAFPRLIDRILWVLPLGALLALGWTVWQTLEYLAARLSRTATNRAAPLLPVALLGALALASVSPIWVGVQATAAQDEIPQDQSTCLDPTFRWMQDVVTTPSVVLAAPNTDSTCLPAYVNEAQVILYRVPNRPDAERARASGPPVDTQASVEQFLNAPVVDEEMLEMLRVFQVSYVLLPQNSPLNLQLGHLPGITPLDNPGERYRLYRVDYPALVKTSAVTMNYLLNLGDSQAALSLLEPAVQENEDERFLAYLAAGQANMEEEKPDRAVYDYEQALLLFPDSPGVYPLLADAHVAMDDYRSAASVLERAVALYPEDVDLRYKLGYLLLALGDEEEALEHYQEVVEMFPDVPDYHVRLGEALTQTGDFSAEELSNVVNWPRSRGVLLLASFH